MSAIEAARVSWRSSRATARAESGGKRAWRDRACILLLAGAALAALSAGASSARHEEPARDPAHRLTLLIRDDVGSPIAARVRVVGSDGRLHPDSVDAGRLVHLACGGYFYAADSCWVDVPAGETRITAGSGFERRPWDETIEIAHSTTVTIVLDRIVDLGDEGWFGGDMHTHANHGPPDYVITPEVARLVARAEGLSVIHCLDQEQHFTGAPHPLSDAHTILYYSWEHRNQAYGHMSLPGLRLPVGSGCCEAPFPAYPMLLDLRAEVVPAKGPMIVLAHPHTTDDSFDDDGWPGWGLGREAPLLAALGSLDAFDVLSYSNSPFDNWSEWYDLVSSGIRSVPSAGTDAALNHIFSPPPGGFRVYARQSVAGRLDYDLWLSAVLEGRVFVTNYPLLPVFEVNGVAPGGTLEAEEPEMSLTVRMRAVCSLGLRALSLIADNGEVWSAVVGDPFPQRLEVDTTFALKIPSPAWICARATGIPGHPHALLGDPLAQTNAIRFVRAGAPIVRSDACGRMLDRLDSLSLFVDRRGNWSQPWHEDTVEARIDRARRWYARAFVLPPDAFALLEPADDDTVLDSLLRLHWAEARDPEAGDDVDYWVSIIPDSIGLGAQLVRVEDHAPLQPALVPGHRYRWGVEAIDRGGNRRPSTPDKRHFHLLHDEMAQTPLPTVDGKTPRVIPNPAEGSVLIEGFDRPVLILDVGGRMVAGSGCEVVARPDGRLQWSGRMQDGRDAPAGVYFVRGGRRGSGARLIRIR